MVLSMERWKNKVAIVTGASSGCGEDIAGVLVSFGMQVVGFARRIDRLEDLSKQLSNKPGKLHPFRGDVTIEEDVIGCFEWTKNNLGPIHILVNSAGIAEDNNLLDGNFDMWRKIIDTNVLGLCLATREAVNDMRKNGVDGHIVHVNSLLGHFVYNVPNLSVYPATKFAVTALTETLRQELISIGSNIKVTSISPGPIDTEFFNGVKSDSELGTFVKTLPKLKADDVSDAIVYALSTPPTTLVNEILLRPMGVLV